MLEIGYVIEDAKKLKVTLPFQAYNFKVKVYRL